MPKQQDVHPDPHELFVGRLDEMEHLQRALDRVVAGQGRMAMLVGEPGAERPQVAVVAEDREEEAVATALAARLRRAGMSAEPFTTGNPRKRYDRALKAEPASTVALRGGERNVRVLRPGEVDEAGLRMAVEVEA